MTPGEMAGVASAIVAILVVVVATSKFIFKASFERREAALIGEKDSLERRLSDLDLEYSELRSSVTRAGSIGQGALETKMQIDDDLLRIMRVIHAERGSIYIPLTATSSQRPTRLVFLSIKPSGPIAEMLRRQRIPLDSDTGTCFRTGKPYLDPNPNEGPRRFHEADQVSGHTTKSTLSVPLVDRGDIIGVLQLLDKEEAIGFHDGDVGLVEPLAADLAPKVANLLRFPNYLELLGLIPDREAEAATIMFCDLTNSQTLFNQSEGTSYAIQHINEYLEVVCASALTCGGVVDVYQGDGAMLVFNVPPRLGDDHSLVAAKAALEIQQAFERLKNRWIIMKDPVQGLYSRIGLASGPVVQAPIGHPQTRHLTIFGTCVNVASALCEAAPRDRNNVVVDEHVYERTAAELDMMLLPAKNLGKAAPLITSAYELHG